MKCKICKINGREWSWQPFGPDSDALSFSMPGWHYRGFPVLPICDACKKALEAGETRQFIYQGHAYIINGPDDTAMLPVRFVREKGGDLKVHVLVVYNEDWDVSCCSITPHGHDWADVSLNSIVVGDLCEQCFGGFKDLVDMAKDQQRKHKARRVA